MSLDHAIALIGAGNMAEALIAGLQSSGLAAADRLWATDTDPSRLTLVQSRFQIRVGRNNSEAAAWGQIVVLAVEPQVLDEVVREVAPHLRPGCLVISVAAGVPISTVSRSLGATRAVVRAMPNTPSSVLCGMTALSFGPGVSSQQAAVSRAMFETVGKVVEVEERLMDAVTGLSGSGPAYVCVMIEALADGGVKMGLPRETAQVLAAQTVLGAARMLLEGGEHPGRLKDRVASPGGTTIAGLHALETGKFRATLMAAVEAAANRSRELGAESTRREP
jgi:pyrroline-5-carboxylate reductase